MAEYLQIDGLDFRIDLGAQRVLAAQKQGQKIAIEVKSFVKGIATELEEFGVSKSDIVLEFHSP